MMKTRGWREGMESYCLVGSESQFCKMKKDKGDSCATVSMSLLPLNRMLKTTRTVNHVCSVTQSCLTLCSLMGCNPPGSSAQGIFQARILEWDAISYSRGSSLSGIKPKSPASPAMVGRFFTTSATWETQDSTFSVVCISPQFFKNLSINRN